MRVALAFVAASLCGGCSLDVCHEHPPAFELDITVNDDVDAPVTNLEVRLEYGEERFVRDFEVGDALDDGMTSIGVELDPAPIETIRAYVAVSGREGPDPGARVVAYDDERFTFAPDGCNLVPISLEAPDDD